MKMNQFHRVKRLRLAQSPLLGLQLPTRNVQHRMRSVLSWHQMKNNMWNVQLLSWMRRTPYCTLTFYHRWIPGQWRETDREVGQWGHATQEFHAAMVKLRQKGGVRGRQQVFTLPHPPGPPMQLCLLIMISRSTVATPRPLRRMQGMRIAPCNQHINNIFRRVVHASKHMVLCVLRVALDQSSCFLRC